MPLLLRSWARFWAMAPATAWTCLISCWPIWWRLLRPCVFRFPGVPANPPLDPQAEQQRLFENVVAFCAALSDAPRSYWCVEDAPLGEQRQPGPAAPSGPPHPREFRANDEAATPADPDRRHLPRGRARRRALSIELLVDLNRERLATRLKLARLSPEGTRDLLAALLAEEITPDFLPGHLPRDGGQPLLC